MREDLRWVHVCYNYTTSCYVTASDLFLLCVSRSAALMDGETFKAVERVLSGAVSKVLSKHRCRAINIDVELNITST